jgi:hypothetical protein
MNVKVDRIGRYLSVMETRAEHCRQEAARYAQRAKRAQSKIDRTKSMVLYYLESHDLKSSNPTTSPCGVRRIRRTASSFRIPMHFHPISGATSEDRRQSA